MKIALLVFPLDSFSSTTTDHIYALKKYVQGEITVCAIRRGEIPINLRSFDALIIHHSAVIYPYRNMNVGFSNDSLKALKSFPGIKLAFAQDEYRSIIERRTFFNNIELNHLFSLSAPSGHETIYGPTNDRSYSISTVLPGYISDQMLQWNSATFKERAIDVGYRGRMLPVWMGDVSNLKSGIVQLIQREIHAKKIRVNTDLSADEADRLYGNSWKDFLNSTKSQIATGSGASMLDIDGRFVESHFGKPRISIEAEDPIAFDYHMISPRIFDYAVSGNVIIRVRGHDYGGVLNEENSVTLYEDASNLESVVGEINQEDKYMRLIHSSNRNIVFNEEFHFSKLGKEVNKQLGVFIKTDKQVIQNISVNIYKLITKRENTIMLHKSDSFKKRILVGYLFYIFKLFKFLRF
jgi:hypothetical protein